MKRFSDRIMTFAGLITTLVLVYLHRTKVPHKEESEVPGPKMSEETHSKKERLISKDIAHEPPGGGAPSDLAQLIDPPAGKTTRWISSSIFSPASTNSLSLSPSLQPLSFEGTISVSVSNKHILQHLPAPQSRTMLPFSDTTSATSTMKIRLVIQNPCLANMDSWARWLTSSR